MNKEEIEILMEVKKKIQELKEEIQKLPLII